MAFSRRSRSLLLGLGLLVLVVLTVLHVRAKLARGEGIFWLEELWAPTAFFSIGLVTCIEYLLPPPKPAVQAPRRAPKRKKA